MKKGFWGCEACGAAFKPHPNLDFDGSGNRLIPARDFFLEKKQKRARCSGLPSRFILCRTCRAKPPVWAAFPFASLMRRARHTLRVPCGRLEPGSDPAHARNRGGPRCAVMPSGRQMRRFEGVWWRKRQPAGEHGGAFCGGGFGGRGGASAGRALGKIRKSFRAAMLVALRLNPIRIWISMGAGIASSRRGTSLEKKQKRARCSGLPSRFILCRTCRAKAACLGGVSVCIPRAAGAACSSSTVRQIGTRLWPCASAQGAAPRGAMMRCGRQMRWFEGVWWRFAPAGGRGWRGIVQRWFRRAWWRDTSEKPWAFFPVRTAGYIQRNFGVWLALRSWLTICGGRGALGPQYPLHKRLECRV